METGEPDYNRSQYHFASMGPRSFDHGNSLICLFDGGFRALGTLSKCFATENNKFCFPVRVLRGKLPSCERSWGKHTALNLSSYTIVALGSFGGSCVPSISMRFSLVPSA